MHSSPSYPGMRRQLSSHPGRPRFLAISHSPALNQSSDRRFGYASLLLALSLTLMPRTGRPNSRSLSTTPEPRPISSTKISEGRSPTGQPSHSAFTLPVVSMRSMPRQDCMSGRTWMRDRLSRQFESSPKRATSRAQRTSRSFGTMMSRLLAESTVWYGMIVSRSESGNKPMTRIRYALDCSPYLRLICSTNRSVTRVESKAEIVNVRHISDILWKVSKKYPLERVGLESSSVVVNEPDIEPSADSKIFSWTPDASSATNNTQPPSQWTPWRASGFSSLAVRASNQLSLGADLSSIRRLLIWNRSRIASGSLLIWMCTSFTNAPSN